MAYRRRHSAKSSSTFVEDAPSSPYHEDGSSLAARAIRASSLHRDSSFSAAYGESALASPSQGMDEAGDPYSYQQQQQNQQQQQEGLTIVESKAADIISDTRKLNIRRKATSGTPGQTQQPIYPDAKNLHMPSIYTPSTQTDYETQLKASRDVAMAMAAKAKLLLRELKTVKADLAFAKQRCTQLEEENRILRESNERGDSPEDDDLIRLQLETLLAEKARLAHENSIYARENRFLREIVEYHQLTMQDVVYLDEGIEEVKEVCPITIPFETQHAQVPSPTLHTSPVPPGSASDTPHAPPTLSSPPVASSPPAPLA